jgi:hypothetical protein
MKREPNPKEGPRFTPDSQARLVAYTTAASLGALFAGQNADAQVTLSSAFAPYPATLPASTSTNTTVFPMDVEGDGVPDFNILVFGEGNTGLTPPKSQVLDFMSLTNSVIGPNQTLNSAARSYLEAWLGGLTINGTTGVAPTYKPRVAIAYYFLGKIYLNNKFPVPAALGFSFVSGVDGQTHFGYMDIKVNTTNVVVGSVTNKVIASLTVNDVYYEATPNTGITVPVSVAITNITVDAGNNVVIDFSSNDNADPSTFTLETSPTLGPSASWSTDNSAAIGLISAANPHAARPLAYYQAITTATGGPTQFYRIKH